MAPYLARFTALFFLLISVSHAGRPVFQDLTRAELVTESGLIFSGEPSQAPAIGKCADETSRWHILHVLKGDPSLSGKVISVALHGYRFMKPKDGSKSVSYAAKRYGSGT